MEVEVYIRFKGKEEIALTGKYGDRGMLANVINTLITAKDVDFLKMGKWKKKIKIKH